ncbi:MAG: hypothetical protein A2X36_03705 [Elusimicrobia bacterium GWA2_69_24]|nr:MAG: hypothetical protein A2X36_03705 [Elusimicrobia bacterium GWA2_69_24]
MRTPLILLLSFVLFPPALRAACMPKPPEGADKAEKKPGFTQEQLSIINDELRPVFTLAARDPSALQAQPEKLSMLQLNKAAVQSSVKLFEDWDAAPQKALGDQDRAPRFLKMREVLDPKKVDCLQASVQRIQAGGAPEASQGGGEPGTGALAPGKNTLSTNPVPAVPGGSGAAGADGEVPQWKKVWDYYECRFYTRFHTGEDCGAYPGDP